MQVKNKKKGIIMIVAIALVLALFIRNSLITNTSLSRTDNEVRSYTSLYFCSNPEDKQCNDSSSKLQYRIQTRSKTFKNLYGYRKNEGIILKVQDITLRFEEKTEQLFTSEISLYADTDKDESFNSDNDEMLAKGFIKGKRILFEDLNYKITIPGGMKSVDHIEQFFIKHGDSGELFQRELLDRIEVKTINTSRENEVVKNKSAYADLSVYMYTKDQDLSKNDFLLKHPFVKSAGNNKLKLPAGKYEFKSTIVIPKNLELLIEPGTTIKLGEQVSFVSYSPISIKGTKKNPVIVKALNENPWGSFAVIGKIGTFGDTIIDHAIFENGSEAEINGAYLSGMLSLYRNNKTIITNSEFRNASADDSLNIKYSEVSLSNNIFTNNSADAFDGDFVTGKIFKNTFTNNGNDGLDFSGSELTIYSNDIQDSGDKGISVGEESKVNIKDNRIDSCNIGIQVKDASDATIENNLLLNSKVSGLDAYVKKLFFGEPKINYQNNIFINNTKDTTGLIDATKMTNNYKGKSLEEFTELYWIKQWL